MAQELLDGVQMRAGLQQMRGKGMTQRMHRGRREVELFAGDNDQPLQGTRHGSRCRLHALGQGLGSLVAAAHIGKEPARMPVKAQ